MIVLPQLHFTPPKNLTTLPAILQELKMRLDGREANELHSSIVIAVHAPILVYVDDEEENIFIFKRYFGKALQFGVLSPV